MMKIKTFFHKLFGWHIKGFLNNGLPIMPIGRLHKKRNEFDYIPKMVGEMMGKEIIDEFQCPICKMYLLEEKI